MPTLKAGPRKQVRESGTGGVPIDSNIFAGESAALVELGRTMQRSGRQFANWQKRREYTEYVNQFNDGKLAAQEWKSDFYEQNAGNTDQEGLPKLYNKEWKDFTGKYLSDVSNSRASSELEREFAFDGDKEELSLFKDVRKNAIRKVQNDMPRIRTDSAVEYADITGEDEKAGDLLRKTHADRYLARVKEHEKMGMLPPGSAEAETRLYAKAIAMEDLERDPEITQKVIESGDISGVLMSEELAKSLTSGDRDEIRTAAIRKNNFRHLKQKTALEAEKVKAEEQIWDIARTGDVNGVADLIDTYPFDAEWKKKQMGDAHRTANLLKDDKPNPYTTVSDPATYWSNYTKVLQDPASMTETEITAMVPDICGITHAQAILRLKKSPENDPLKSPQAKMYIQGLDELYVDEEMTREEWDKANRALTDYITKNPDAPPKELSEFYNGLKEPYVGKTIIERIKELLTSIGSSSELPWESTLGYGGRKPEEVKTETKYDYKLIDEKKKTRARTLFKEVIFNPDTGVLMGRNSKEEQWKTVR